MFHGILMVTAFGLKVRYVDLTLSFNLLCLRPVPVTHAVDAVLGTLRIKILIEAKKQRELPVTFFVGLAVEGKSPCICFFSYWLCSSLIFHVIYHDF